MILAHGIANSRHCFVELLPRRMSGVINGAFVFSGSRDHAFDLYALESALPEIIGAQSCWCTHLFVLSQLQPSSAEQRITFAQDWCTELAPGERYWLRRSLEVAPKMLLELHASPKK